MAPRATDGILDGSLVIIGACNLMTVCSAEPTSIAEITTYRLAEQAMVVGDFTIANGDTNGRKITVAAKSAIPITANGNATHVAVSDGTDFIVTTCTTKALTNGDTTNTPAFDIEIADPVAS